MGGGGISKGTEQDQVGFHSKLNVAKTKILVSFDFDHDHALKGSLVAQAEDQLGKWAWVIAKIGGGLVLISQFL